jgi:putative proteasome-type protease
MTYCCGILVRDGLVMLADTRTNAGLDNISTFRKLHVFERPGEAVLLLASAGNLSISQGVVRLLTEGFQPQPDEAPTRLLEAVNMSAAAQLVGVATRRARAQTGEGLEQSGVNFDVSFLFGGQIGGAPMRLFMIYSAGNAIECTSDTPYFQIGEHKYGKPILDRAISFDTEIYDALKIGMISMDSTMRSNLSVGLPLDMTLLRRDALALELSRRIDATDPYFRDLREQWSKALKDAHMAIPRPPYGPEAA